MADLAYRWEVTREVATAPRVSVELAGPLARRFYDQYTARHARFKVVPAKRWGVALQAVPASADAYLEPSSRRYLRRRRRRALGKGYAFRPFETLERVREMLDVNRSAPVRQGHEMAASYVQEKVVRRFCEAHPVCDGVFDREDRLRAYAHAPVVGEVRILHRLLGHADDLADGVMYLLVSEIVAASAAASGPERPRWVMYDTFWGAEPGLAEFKRRTGFTPYRVDWVWRGDG